MQNVTAIMLDLENEIPLQPKHRVHPLQGEYKGCLECHITPDWLLIYQTDKKAGDLYFVRTGTHSDLF